MCLENCFRSIFCCCSKRRHGHQSVCVKGWAALCDWYGFRVDILVVVARHTLQTNRNFVFFCLNFRRRKIIFRFNFVWFQLHDLYDSRTNLLSANGIVFNHETDVEIRPGISFYVTGIILNNCEGYELFENMGFFNCW